MEVKLHLYLPIDIHKRPVRFRQLHNFISLLSLSGNLLPYCMIVFLLFYSFLSLVVFRSFLFLGLIHHVSFIHV
jgi:hypothetical protein